jgi:hypothetical protein
MRKHITSRNAAFFAAGGFVAALFLAGAAHAITDTIFKYSAPKTGHYALDPIAFAPNQSSDTYVIGDVPDAVYDTSGLGKCFGTGVNLPQGATMTAFAAWYSSDVNGNINVWLGRNKLSDGTFDYIAQLASTNTTKTRRPMNTTIPGSLVASVDNALYSYHVGVCFGTSGANSRFYGGRIAYTYTNAGD